MMILRKLEPKGQTDIYDACFRFDKTINKIAGYPEEHEITLKTLDIALGRLKIAEEYLRGRNQELEMQYNGARESIHNALKEHLLLGKDASYIVPTVKKITHSKIAEALLNQEEEILKSANILRKDDSLNGGEVGDINKDHTFFVPLNIIEKCACELEKNKINQKKIRNIMDKTKKKIRNCSVNPSLKEGACKNRSLVD